MPYEVVERLFGRLLPTDATPAQLFERVLADPALELFVVDQYRAGRGAHGYVIRWEEVELGDGRRVRGPVAIDNGRRILRGDFRPRFDVTQTFIVAGHRRDGRWTLDEPHTRPSSPDDKHPIEWISHADSPPRGLWDRLLGRTRIGQTKQELLDELARHPNIEVEADGFLDERISPRVVRGIFDGARAALVIDSTLRLTLRVGKTRGIVGLEADPNRARYLLTVNQFRARHGLLFAIYTGRREARGYIGHGALYGAGWFGLTLHAAVGAISEGDPELAHRATRYAEQGHRALKDAGLTRMSLLTWTAPARSPFQFQDRLTARAVRARGPLGMLLGPPRRFQLQPIGVADAAARVGVDGLRNVLRPHEHVYRAVAGEPPLGAEELEPLVLARQLGVRHPERLDHDGWVATVARLRDTDRARRQKLIETFRRRGSDDAARARLAGRVAADETRGLRVARLAALIDSRRDSPQTVAARLRAIEDARIAARAIKSLTADTPGARAWGDMVAYLPDGGSRPGLGKIVVAAPGEDQRATLMRLLVDCPEFLDDAARTGYELEYLRVTERGTSESVGSWEISATGETELESARTPLEALRLDHDRAVARLKEAAGGLVAPSRLLSWRADLVMRELAAEVGTDVHYHYRRVWEIGQAVERVRETRRRLERFLDLLDPASSGSSEQAELALAQAVAVGARLAVEQELARAGTTPRLMRQLIAEPGTADGPSLPPAQAAAAVAYHLAASKIADLETQLGRDAEPSTEQMPKHRTEPYAGHAALSPLARARLHAAYLKLGRAFAERAALLVQDAPDTDELARVSSEYITAAAEVDWIRALAAQCAEALAEADLMSAASERAYARISDASSASAADAHERRSHAAADRAAAAESRAASIHDELSGGFDAAEAAATPTTIRALHGARSVADNGDSVGSADSVRFGPDAETGASVEPRQHLRWRHHRR